MVGQAREIGIAWTWFERREKTRSDNPASPRRWRSGRTRNRISIGQDAGSATNRAVGFASGMSRPSGAAAQEAASGSTLRKQGGEATRGWNRDQERTPELSGNVSDCFGSPVAGREEKVVGKQSQPNAAQRGRTTPVLRISHRPSGQYQVSRVRAGPEAWRVAGRLRVTCLRGSSSDRVPVGESQFG